MCLVPSLLTRLIVSVYLLIFVNIFLPFELDGDLVPCAIEQICRLLVCNVFGLGAADPSDDIPLAQHSVCRRAHQHLERDEKNIISVDYIPTTTE